MSDLRNYLMKPIQMKNNLDLYPIKIMEYERFRDLAAKYLILDIPQLNNKRRQEGISLLEFDNLFDYLKSFIDTDRTSCEIVKKIKEINKLTYKEKKDLISSSEDIKNMILNEKVYKNLNLQHFESEIIEMMTMVIKKKVAYNDKIQCFDIYDENDELIACIDSYNFYEFRKIVMEQNLLFEPLIAPNKKAQKYIDASLRNDSGQESDIEAIVAFVSTNSFTGDISNYTYYRLMAEFRSLIKQMNRSDVVSYSAAGATKKNGSPLDIPNIVSKLEVNKNPYDDVFKEVNKNEKDK